MSPYISALTAFLANIWQHLRPRWLVSKGRGTEALAALGKLRQKPPTDPRIQQEWFDIRAEVAFHKETSALRHPNLQDRSVMSRVKLEIASWIDVGILQAITPLSEPRSDSSDMYQDDPRSNSDSLVDQEIY